MSALESIRPTPHGTGASESCDAGGASSVYVDDAELIGRVISGEIEAFDALMRRYSPVVYGWLCSKNADVARNEDLLQEVFLAAYGQLAGLRNRERFGPWVIRIAKNRLIDLRRREQRATIESRRMEQEAGPSAVLARPAPDPRESAALGETERIVLAAIARLGERYGVVVHMRLIGDQTPQEIARQLGLKESTVRMRLSRGLERLRKLVSKDIAF